ncbi:MAG: hypothetical protein Q9227_006579 [Pyrenula ochraceoflavens]
MGRLNLSAIRHRSRALAALDSRPQMRTPSWMTALASIPISQPLLRQQPTAHPVPSTRTRTLPLPPEATPEMKLNPPTETVSTLLHHGRRHTPKSSRKRQGKRSRLFQPVKIEYEEDHIRQMFYKDHPWELARPRIVQEQSGDDAGRYGWDWSTGIEQPGKPLNGESVVHRTLYLLENEPDITLAHAYTKARREFYAIRHQEDVTRRIAVEEATHTGAVYPDYADPIVSGMRREDAAFAEWRSWAIRERELKVQGRSSGAPSPAVRRGATGDRPELDEDATRPQMDALDAVEAQKESTNAPARAGSR